MSYLRICGNLTNSEEKELTNRIDIWLNKTYSSNINVILLENNKRLVTGLSNGTSDIQATLRNKYFSNKVTYKVKNSYVYIEKIILNTFDNTHGLFEDIILYNIQKN